MLMTYYWLTTIWTLFDLFKINFTRVLPSRILVSLDIYYLGIEVSRESSSILLNQRKYILDLLKNCSMENYSPTSFPIPKGLKLQIYDGEKFSDLESYRRIIDKLLYLNMTKPDISYAVQQLSRFISNPRMPHFF